MVVYNDGLIKQRERWWGARDYIFIFIYEDLVLVFQRTF